MPGSLPGARRILGVSDPEAEAAVAADPLTRAERDDLIAFAELLVEGRPLARADREAYVAEIEIRAALDDESLPLYRATVRVLRRLAGQRFSKLGVPARSALIARHRLDSRHVAPGADLGPFGDDVRLVRTRALASLIGAYYGSSAGWQVVGYDTFPGRCGDLARYTRTER